MKRGIRVYDGKSARRLLSRVITQFQKGEISDIEAKRIAYMCSVYISPYNTRILEERLRKIEKKQKELQLQNSEKLIRVTDIFEDGID